MPKSKVSERINNKNGKKLISTSKSKNTIRPNMKLMPSLLDLEKLYEQQQGPNSFSSVTKTFSPMPSTSQDNKTIQKNDEHFNDVYCPNTATDECSDVEIVEINYETIVIDDIQNDFFEVKNSTNNLSQNIVTSEIINIDDFISAEAQKRVIIENKMKEKINSSVIEVPDTVSNINTKSVRECETIVIDEVQNYHTELVKSSNNLLHNMEPPELIDIDNVIAENKIVIEKHCEKGNIMSVIEVPNTVLSNSPARSICNDTNISTCSRSQGIKYCTCQQLPEKPVRKRPIYGSNNTTEDNIAATLSKKCLVKNCNISYCQCKDSSHQNNHSYRPVRITHNANNNTENNNNSIQENIDHLVTNPSDNDILYINNRIKQDVSWLKSVYGDHMYHTGPCGGCNIFQNKTIELPSSILAKIFKNTQHDKSLHDPINLNYNNINSSYDKCDSQNQNSSQNTVGDCPICMDGLTKNAVASTTCGHLFCLKCIATALKKTGKKCPTCRKTLKGKGYHQIFI